MESKQYRITAVATACSPKRYSITVTHGLMDTEIIGYWYGLNVARKAAKDHAAKRGIKPIILT